MELLPDLPNTVNDLILTSIAKAPEQRFQSADAFRFAVQRVAKAMQEDKTFVQGSQDTTVTGAMMPQGHAPTAAFTPPPPMPRSQTPASAPAPRVAAQAPPPVAAMPPAAMKPGSSRGLYMVMGAVILMVVIIAGATYLPNRKQASAAEAEAAKPTAATTTVAPSTAAPATTATPAAVESAPAAEAQPAAAMPKSAAAKSVPAQAAPAGPDPQVVAQAAALAAELDEVEKEIDQLTSRAASVNTGLDNLQRQQAAAGYGLRGDMAAKQSSMKVNLAKAQNAIAANDAVRAKRYAEQTSRDVEALERFLGR